jgi:hypothetical protein
MHGPKAHRSPWAEPVSADWARYAVGELAGSPAGRRPSRPALNGRAHAARACAHAFTCVQARPGPCDQAQQPWLIPMVWPLATRD